MKKEYKKPQVVEVKLIVQNPIMGNCDDLNEASPKLDCNATGASCPWP